MKRGGNSGSFATEATASRDRLGSAYPTTGSSNGPPEGSVQGLSTATACSTPSHLNQTIAAQL
jgi:hypothetical protein